MGSNQSGKIKKLLVITAFPPNRLTAGQNYTRCLLEDLQKDYNIDLITFSYKQHLPDLPTGITIIKNIRVGNFQKIKNILLSPTIHPFFSTRFKRSISDYISSISDEYDILYFDFSQVFMYALFVQHPQKIFMVHDVILQKLSREKKYWYSWLTPFLKATEKKILSAANTIFCFSRKDQSIIESEYGLKSFKVDFYISDKSNVVNKSIAPSQNRYVLFAAWNRKENYEGLDWFLDAVVPFVRKDAVFEIIGQGLSTALQNKILKLENVSYLGFLENPYERIFQANALIAPLFIGAGVKVKVLEALSTGTRVIGTDVAFEGIDLKQMENQMVCCSSANDFIKAIQEPLYISALEKIDAINCFNKAYPVVHAAGLFNSI